MLTAIGLGAAAVPLFGTSSAGVRRAPSLLSGTNYVDGNALKPAGRHLALGADPRSQAAMSRQVPQPVRRPYLRLGTSPGQLDQVVPAEIRHLHSHLIEYADNPASAYFDHDQYHLHAALDGLDPGTRYHYALGHDGLDSNSVAATVGSFRTAPAAGGVPEPFTFTAFGDEGVEFGAAANQTLMLRQNPVFHLPAGDISYAASGAGLPSSHHSAEGADKLQPEVWDEYLRMIDPVAASVPWMVAMGNHDMEALYSPDGYGGHLARRHLPGNGPRNAHATYGFSYGNVAVVSLDANDISHEIPHNRGYTSGAQTTWPAGESARLRRTPGIDFIVAFFHHRAYCTATDHVSDGAIREERIPLFDRYQVDLVINGHNHVYERADPMRGGVRTRRAAIGDRIRPATDGITYLTVGRGGKSGYEFSAPETYAGGPADVTDAVKGGFHVKGARLDETVEWSRVRFRGNAFIAVDVRPAAAGRETTMTIRTLSATGAQIDTVTLVRDAGTAIPSANAGERGAGGGGRG
ncbi:metallophosphoesterase family protein (plasmid) [Embleya sp. NBC_00888]|uniref:purple acid phosphatase family protein n=1 Tax=Embleya sp. NBC_00888 TaxID=2975960 RepID=UPI002F916D0C|nr:metallophosphoesterase family protein [Embleya sp. NBC_00888]